MRYFLGFFLSGACDSADAATDFSFLVESLSRRISDALVATDFEVFSFFAMRFSGVGRDAQPKSLAPISGATH